MKDKFLKLIIKDNGKEKVIKFNNLKSKTIKLKTVVNTKKLPPGFVKFYDKNNKEVNIINN
jgi:hypothetical protein